MFSCEEIARTQIGVCRKYISKGLKSGNQTVAMHKDLKLNKYMYHTVNTIDDNQSNSYIKMDWAFGTYVYMKYSSHILDLLNYSLV